LQQNRVLRALRETPETPADNPMTNKLGAAGWDAMGLPVPNGTNPSPAGYPKRIRDS